MDGSTPDAPVRAAPNQPAPRTATLATEEERNGARVADLLLIQDALLFYEQEEDGFPSTGGRLQTLCAYPDLDSGCDLTQVINDIPRDPAAGESYLYQSDGENFVVAAGWEGDSEPPAGLDCPFAMQPEDGRRICVTDETNAASVSGLPTPEATNPPAGESAPRDAPGSPEDRNETRLADLQVIRDALLEYREAEGEFPATAGRVQTLCTYVDHDVGCALEDVIGEVPRDPSGGNFGYFYASDGETFIVASVWEGNEETPDEFACPDSDLQLPDEERLACVTEGE